MTLENFVGKYGWVILIVVIVIVLIRSAYLFYNYYGERNKVIKLCQQSYDSAKKVGTGFAITKMNCEIYGFNITEEDKQKFYAGGEI